MYLNHPYLCTEGFSKGTHQAHHTSTKPHVQFAVALAKFVYVLTIKTGKYFGHRRSAIKFALLFM